MGNVLVSGFAVEDRFHGRPMIFRGNGSVIVSVHGVACLNHVEVGSTSWLFTDALVRTDAEQVLLRADEDLSLRNGR
jgi:hypothetical protein